MKCVLLLALLASISHAEELSRSGSNRNATSPNEGGGHIDLVLLMLGQIKKEVAVLNVKTDNLKQANDDLKDTTNSLQTSVNGLAIRMGNMETKVSGKR